MKKNIFFTTFLAMLLSQCMQINESEGGIGSSGRYSKGEASSAPHGVAYRLQNAAFGRCLSVLSGPVRQNDRVFAYPCSEEQEGEQVLVYELAPNSSTIYRLRFASTNYCLEIPDGGYIPATSECLDPADDPSGSQSVYIPASSNHTAQIRTQVTSSGYNLLKLEHFDTPYSLPPDGETGPSTLWVSVSNTSVHSYDIPVSVSGLTNGQYVTLINNYEYPVTGETFRSNGEFMYNIPLLTGGLYIFTVYDEETNADKCEILNGSGIANPPNFNKVQVICSEQIDNNSLRNLYVNANSVVYLKPTDRSCYSNESQILIGSDEFCSRPVENIPVYSNLLLDYVVGFNFWFDFDPRWPGLFYVRPASQSECPAGVLSGGNTCKLLEYDLSSNTFTLLAPENMPTTTTDYFQLRNKASGLCLDINRGETYNGANVQLYTCKGQEEEGRENQLWEYDSTNASDRFYSRFRSKLDSSKCLSQQPPANPVYPVNLVIWDCNGEEASPLYNFSQEEGSYYNTFVINSLAESVVITGEGTESGDNADVRPYDQEESQQWELVY